MKRLLLTALLLLASSAWSADTDPFSQCHNQADYDLGISIPFFKGKGPLRGQLADAESMLNIQRKPTLKERQALVQYWAHSERCLAQYYLDNDRPPPRDPAALPAIKRLSAGVITFAEYAKYRIKDLRESERLFAQYELEEQERRKQEERNRPITLSCIARINGSEGFDSEHQFQINEEAKTIWASRGKAAPSSINIGPTEITFMQADVSTRISRNTGRFSITSGSDVWSGTCQTITQRKF